MKHESEIENSVCNYAKNLGWEAFKMNASLYVGIPDRLFLRNGLAFFIEFKRNSKCKMSVIQKRISSSLINNGFDVIEVNSIIQGKEVIDEKTRDSERRSSTSS